MVATRAVEVLTRSDTPFFLHEYRYDPAAPSTGLAAAAALGAAPDRVFKTLVLSADGALVVAVLPVSKQLDVKALGHAMGAKRVVLTERVLAERATGYVVGGISPLGQRRQVRTALDTSATDWPTVFVSGGRRGLEIELAPAALIELTGALLVSLARTVPGAILGDDSIGS
jgi:Cys-tRNA(Pro)/Cys-tRNA(Cys) deacylase